MMYYGGTEDTAVRRRWLYYAEYRQRQHRIIVLLAARPELTPAERCSTSAPGWPASPWWRRWWSTSWLSSLSPTCWRRANGERAFGANNVTFIAANSDDLERCVVWAGSARR